MDNYNDILFFEHHTSRRHKRMPLISRAAQFASFAALTGLDDAASETARLTDLKHELTDDEKFILDQKLQFLESIISKHPFIKLTYYVPDKKKSGGSYNTISGNIRRINEVEKVIIFENDQTINLNDILYIEIPKD